MSNYSPFLEQIRGWAISDEATSAAIRVERAGFYWWFGEVLCETAREFFVGIRLKTNRWTIVTCRTWPLSAAIIGAYEKFADLLPGLREISID